MPTTDEISPSRLGNALVAADGPSGIRRGDRIWIDTTNRESGLQAWATARGVRVSRTPPPNARAPLGKVLSFSRAVD